MYFFISIKLKRKEIELSPESLRFLVDVIENSNLSNKFFLGSSKILLEHFPILEKLQTYQKKIDELPVHDPGVVYVKK